MPRQQIRNGLLSVLLQEIGFIQAQSPALELFLRPKINQFLKVNEARIRDLNNHIATLNDLYVKKDDKGQGLVEVVEGKARLVFIDDEAAKQYDKLYNEFMNKRIDIVVDTDQLPTGLGLNPLKSV